MGPRVILSMLLLAQLGDAATFMVGEALHGISLESNGVAVLAYDAGGLAGVLALKGVALLLVLGVAASTVTRFPRLFVWLGAAATSLGLLGCFANVASLLLLS
jgi:hypothetical protein